MSTPLAFTWLVWRRHHAGLLAVTAYLLAAAIVSAILPPMMPADGAESVFAPMTMVVCFLILYVMGVFTFAFDQDLAARASCYPSGLLRLPVSTAMLASWPIVGGA